MGQNQIRSKHFATFLVDVQVFCVVNFAADTQRDLAIDHKRLWTEILLIKLDSCVVRFDFVLFFMKIILIFLLLFLFVS